MVGLLQGALPNAISGKYDTGGWRFEKESSLEEAFQEVALAAGTVSVSARGPATLAQQAAEVFGGGCAATGSAAATSGEQVFRSYVVGHPKLASREALSDRRLTRLAQEFF